MNLPGSKCFSIIMLACAGLVGMPSLGHGTPICAPTFTGSSGNLSASVQFCQDGSNLMVTLTNTSSIGAHAPGDVLSAVFFSLAGDPLLTRTSAVLASGSSVIISSGPNPGTDPGGGVGGEWAYRNGLSGGSTLNGANSGISSVGLSTFGPPDLFPGTNRQGPVSPDGIQYGIVGPGGLNNPNGGLLHQGLIKNSVVFTLGGLPSTFNVLTGVSNVGFQYGTAFGEPSFPGHQPRGSPEPATFGLLGLGMAGLGAYRFSRRKRSGPLAS
jgi:hypothetical protein